MSNICEKCNIRMNIYQEDVTDDYDRYNAMMNGREVLDHYYNWWRCPKCGEKVDINYDELATNKQLYRLKKELGMSFIHDLAKIPEITKQEAWSLIKKLNEIEDKDKLVNDYIDERVKDEYFNKWIKSTLGYKSRILLHLLWEENEHEKENI